MSSIINGIYCKKNIVNEFELIILWRKTGFSQVQLQQHRNTFYCLVVDTVVVVLSREDFRLIQFNYYHCHRKYKFYNINNSTQTKSLFN